MKIAVLASYAPSLVNFRGPLIRRMVELGHEVIAIAPPHDPSPGHLIAELGATYITVPLLRRGLNPLVDLRTVFALTSVFREHKPDLLLSYTIKPVVYGSLAAKLAGVPNIYSMITGLGYAFTQAHGFKRRMLFNFVRGLYKAGLRHNNGVLFQNQDDLDFFHKLGVLQPGTPTVITGGSGVDLDHFAPVPLPEKPVFLCLSRLLKAKGVVEFAEASVALKARYPEATFRLAGPREQGPDSIPVDDIARWQAAGLEVLDPVDDVRPLISGSSVCVLPSWREGTPRFLLEAMAMGRAIITTDAPGCRQTIPNGDNGLLVPLHDTTALESAMEQFIADPARAEVMGTAGLDLARERFDVRKVNDVILDFMGVS